MALKIGKGATSRYEEMLSAANKKAESSTQDMSDSEEQPTQTVELPPDVFDTWQSLVDAIKSGNMKLARSFVNDLSDVFVSNADEMSEPSEEIGSEEEVGLPSEMA